MIPWLTAAHACGAFFCNPATPVDRIDQAGESVVFVIDEGAREVSMHVEIVYEGRVEDFAWIVPVPSEPEVELSTPALFDVLRNTTNPVYSLATPTGGNCGGGPGPVGCVEFSIAKSDSLGVGDTPVNSWVEVGETARVGAYETVSLRASSEDALLAWLREREFQIPESTSSALAPYIAEESWFLAMRLAQDATTGALDPITLRFSDTTTPTIPLRLTSLAAVPDMPITVWILADQTYGPSNIPRVRLNPTRLDWWDGLSVDAVLKDAIDEAGGQAWLAEGNLFMETPPVASTSIRDLTRQLEAADNGNDFLDIIETELLSLAPYRADTADILDVLAPCADSSTLQSLDPLPAELLEACTARAIEGIFEPRWRAQAALNRYPVRSRWRTMVSPEEMQTDPQFAPAPLTGTTPNVANDTRWCGTSKDRAKQRRTLAVGEYSVPLPSNTWLSNHDMTTAEFIASAGAPAAERVEMLGEDGTWETLVDQRQDIADSVGALRKGAPAGRPCGLRHGRGSAPFLLVMLVLLRRRRTTAG